MLDNRVLPTPASNQKSLSCTQGDPPVEGCHGGARLGRARFYRGSFGPECRPVIVHRLNLGAISGKVSLFAALKPHPSFMRGTKHLVRATVDTAAWGCSSAALPLRRVFAAVVPVPAGSMRSSLRTGCAQAMLSVLLYQNGGDNWNRETRRTRTRKSSCVSGVCVFRLVPGTGIGRRTVRRGGAIHPGRRLTLRWHSATPECVRHTSSSPTRPTFGGAKSCPRHRATTALRASPRGMGRRCMPPQSLLADIDDDTGWIVP